MTPQEHELATLKARSLAQDAILEWVAGVLRLQYAFQPEPQRAAALEAAGKKLQAARDDYAAMTISGVNPALSDMYAALFQEQFDEVSKAFFSHVSKPASAEEIQRVLNSLKSRGL